MATAPLWLRCAITAGLAVVVVLAHFGPPPRSPRDLGQIVLLSLAALLLYAGAIVAIVRHDNDHGAVFFGVAILVTCLAVWLSRAPRRDDGGEDPIPPTPPHDPGEPDRPVRPPAPSWDWDAFDRARSSWDRGHAAPPRPARR